MTRIPLLIPFLAAAALAGCDSGGQTIVQNGPPDPMANQLAAAPPVELPASIASSETYRCKDNSLVYIDWLEKNGQPAGANFRAEQTGAPTPLKPGTDGQGPFTADGYSLTGTKDAGSITLERPGKGSQSCKA